MALWFELLLSGVLPIAFALWQIHDVRREQRRRAEQRRQEEARAMQADERHEGEPPSNRN